MNILVINAGSSSLKYQLIDMSNESVLAIGNCERIGISGGIITHKTHSGLKTEEECYIKNHEEALNKVTRLLTEGSSAVIKSLAEIQAIGHRVVQGGEKYTKSVVINDEVLKVIDDCSALAPLHNPSQFLTIKVCQRLFGDSIPQVAVFDTSFHQTMPKKAYIYGIPYEYYEKYGLRRYGFHGTSHRYVSERCAALMNKDIKDLKIITCHLGNGCSIAAIDKGESVDTSMGLTPLGGFVMGTRCGDLDPGILSFIYDKEGLSISDMDVIFNKKSGFLGISGISSDARDLEKEAANGNERAKLALEIQHYQVKKFIGSYVAAMGGVDAVVFTGGIGENSIIHREAILKDMEFFGIKLDKEKNNTRGGEVLITTDDSKTKVFIISTNEELVIAKDTVNLIK